MSGVEIRSPRGGLPYISFRDPTVCMLAIGETNDNENDLNKALKNALFEVKATRYIAEQVISNIVDFAIELSHPLTDRERLALQQKILTMLESLE
jgi:hypothetical protein